MPSKPSMPLNRTLTSSLAGALVLAVALGCSGLRKADAAYDDGRYLEALAQYQAALKKDPKNVKAKIGYRRTAPLAAEQHLKNATAAQKAGREELERSEVGAAVVLDPNNQVAVDWLTRIEEAAARKRAQDIAQESVAAERAKADSKPTLPINPRSLEGLDLNFTRKTSLKEIFLQLSRTSGVNIILHASAAATDPIVSVDLRGLSFQRILDTLMLQSDLFYKVIDPNTIMVFRSTPQNLLYYENKLIKTFYLSNAEVEMVRQTFNTLLPTMRVFIDKRLNALTVMARQNDVNIATRIVNQMDKAKAEVMIYLELLEVTQNATERVGLMPFSVTATGGRTPSYGLGAIVNPNTAGGGVNALQGTLKISKSNLQFLVPSLALDMLKTSGEGKLLASPNVRVISGETGEVNIGDKLTTTQSSLTGVGGAAADKAAASSSLPLAQTQYGYEEVGIKIKVKPRVHFNKDITLELESDIKTRIPGGTLGRPDLSQRIIKTQARLRDGETAVFAGLLQEEERKDLQGIWGVADIPILGGLLSHHNNEDKKKDVILTIRAVVIRQPDLREVDFEAFDPDQAGMENKPFAAPPEPECKPEAETEAKP